MSVFKLMIAIAGLVIAAVPAQAREAASYDQALAMSEALSMEMFETSVRDSRRREVVALANLLKNFTLNEGEVRAGGKVAPPLQALARPGESPKQGLMGQAAGEEVSLSQVPDEWFLGMMESARGKLKKLIVALDRPDVKAGELKGLAQGVHRDLELVVHPPRQ